MNQQTLFKTIQKTILPGDVLRFAFDLKVFFGGAKHKRIVALVGHKTSKTNAIFTFKKKMFSSYQIDWILPINDDFDILIRGDKNFDFQYKGLILCFEPITVSSIHSQIISETTKGLRLWKSTKNIQAHLWINLYLPSDSSFVYKVNKNSSKPRGDSFITNPKDSMSNTKDNPFLTNNNSSVVMFQDIKIEWIASQLVQRELKFTFLRDLVLLCGTFNVNNKKPLGDLSSWFSSQISLSSQFNFSGYGGPTPADSTGHKSQLLIPDIVAIGLQEVDLTAEGLIFNDSYATKGKAWEASLAKVLFKNLQSAPVGTQSTPLTRTSTIAGIANWLHSHHSFPASSSNSNNQSSQQRKSMKSPTTSLQANNRNMNRGSYQHPSHHTSLDLGRSNSVNSPSDNSQLSSSLHPSSTSSSPESHASKKPNEPTNLLIPAVGIVQEPPQSHPESIEQSHLEKYTYTGPDGYVIIATKQLVGTLIFVFVRNYLVPHISNVHTDATGCGLLGVMGNKGGVAISLNIYDSSICFINSHLAAHHDNYARRNDDFHHIQQKLSFDYSRTPYSSSLTGGSNSQHQNRSFARNDSSSDNQRRTVLDHDVLIWMGDLNYRLNEDDDLIRKGIKNNRLTALASKDQLTIQKNAGRAFHKYEEGPFYNFKPSYKFDPGTIDSYDTSEKHRKPAWCDRILWKLPSESPQKEHFIHQINYTMAPSIVFSDHKPVSSYFVFRAKSVIPHLLKIEEQVIIKELDRMENEIMPDATLDSNTAEFLNCEIDLPQTRILTLTNSGKVAVKYCFQGKNGAAHYTPRWLRIAEPAGILLPGKSAHLSFTTTIDHKTAQDINLGRQTELSDILILHFEHGGDKFIMVNATVLPSVFGSSLEFLCSLHKPVIIDETSPPISDTPQGYRHSIPIALFSLFDQLKEHLFEEELFLTPGRPNEIVHIRKCLDRGKPFPSGFSPHSYAESVLKFLHYLDEPVIPYHLYNQAIEACGSYASSLYVLRQLTQPHFNTFCYIISFLRLLLSKSSMNSLTLDDLAIVFSQALIRAPVNITVRTNNSFQRSVAFISQFLNSVS